MNVLEYILNRYSIENLEISIYGYNNFYIDKSPIHNYDGSKKYLIKWNNKYKLKKNHSLLYFLYKNNNVYLINYNKKTRIYDEYEIMKDIYMDYRIFDLISNYYQLID